MYKFIVHFWDLKPHNQVAILLSTQNTGNTYKLIFAQLNFAFLFTLQKSFQINDT